MKYTPTPTYKFTHTHTKLNAAASERRAPRVANIPLLRLLLLLLLQTDWLQLSMLDTQVQSNIYDSADQCAAKMTPTPTATVTAVAKVDLGKESTLANAKHTRTVCCCC